MEGSNQMQLRAAHRVQSSHCPRCAGYEDAVMRRKTGDVLPPDVKPCDAFAMSDRFRNWAVGQMQKELGGQISAAGLDRMALLKRGSGKGPNQEEQKHGGAGNE